MKKQIKITGTFCDCCDTNITFSNRQSVSIGKKQYDFCNDKCEDIFGKKKRWKGYNVPRKPLHLKKKGDR